MGPSDAQLVKQVLAGKTARYEDLVRRHLPLAYGVAYAQTLNHADAEDSVQETFINAWRRLDTLREPAKFAQWLSVIARNSAQSIRRRRAPQAVSPETQAQAVTPDPAREEIHGIVREHLAQLAEERRDVLVLYYFAGLNTGEIAAKLGISRAAAKKRLQRAREEMGSNLVATLAPALEPKEPFEKQSRRVLGALGVSLVGVPGSARGGTIAGAASGASAKASAWLVPAGAAATLTAMIVASWLVMRPAETAVSVTARSVAGTTPVVFAAAAQNEQNTQPEESAPAEEPAAEASTATARDDESVLSTTVSLKFDDAHLLDVLRELQATTGLTILYDATIIAPPGEADRVVTPAPVVVDDPFVTDGMVPRIELHDVTVRYSLESLTGPLGLDFALEPGRIWISTEAGIRNEVPRHPAARFDRYTGGKALDETTSLLFENRHLEEIIQFIPESYNLNVVLDYRVVRPTAKTLQRESCLPPGTVYAQLEGATPRPVTTGLIPYIQLTDIRVGDALAAILRPLNLAFTARNGLVWISAPSLLHAAGYATYEDPHFTTTESLAETLNEPVSMLFEDVHLYEILRFITESYDFNVGVDFRLVEPPCRPGDEAEAEDTVQVNRAFTTTGEVPWLNVEDVPLKTALFALLHPLELDYELNGETLITSSERRLRGGSARLEPLSGE